MMLANLPSITCASPFKANHLTENIGLAHDVATGDLNGDGYTDLFVVSHFNSHKVYFNNADTIFTPSKQIFEYSQGAKVILEDFDNDGDLDAWIGIDPIFGLPNPRDEIYINDGSGHFTLSEQQFGFMGSNIQRVATLIAGDIDNDGDTDVIRATDPSRDDKSIFRNDGQGIFTEEPQSIDFQSAALADYNNDGYLDIWTIGPSLTIYLNDQTGHFNSDMTVESLLGENITSSRFVKNIIVADVDGDGDLDAQGFTKSAFSFFNNGELVSYGPTSMLPRYINNSDGAFEFQEGIQMPDTGSNPNGILQDWDNDSDLDLWTVGTSSRDSELYITDNGGFWQANEGINIETESQRNGIAKADFNNDGRIDVVTVGSSGSINIWLHEKGFNFTESEQPILSSLANTSLDLTALDINNDGNMDYASANTTGISTFIGDGRGNFDIAWSNDVKQRYTEISSADFNGDGFTDLVTTQTGGGLTQIWLNNHNATFSLSDQQVGTIDDFSYADISTGDYDNDGDQDLLLVKRSQAIEVWQNDGETHFVLKQTLSGDYNYAEFIDMTNDGTLDILSFNAQGIQRARYDVHQYDGKQFNMHPGYTDIEDFIVLPVGLTTFDWDGDGDTDVLKAATHPSGLGQTRYILVNTGNGFRRERIFFNNSSDSNLRVFGAGDFNNDGLIDFYATSNQLLMNRGDNHFERLQPEEVIRLSDVILEDFDNDGDIDAISTGLKPSLQRYINTTIDQDFNGLWYNPAQSGHGLQIDEMFLNGQKHLFVSWYVYQNGQPIWITGVGPVVGDTAVIDMIITEGSGFLPDFDPDQVVRTPWGTMTLSMPNKGQLDVSWIPLLADFSTGEITMQRLTSIAGAHSNQTHIKSCHSGSWYNSTQSGHGMMVQVIHSNDSPQMVLTWFTYINGQQLWLVAQGDITEGKAILTARSGQGGNFPPNFDANDVEFDIWGEITFELIDDTNAHISWSPLSSDFSAGELNVSKLTFIDRFQCH